MSKANGTLLLWALNLVEFMSATTETANLGEDFLEEAFPHAYFTLMDLRIINHEPTPRPAGRTGQPLPDNELLTIVASKSASIARPYSIRGLVTQVVAHRDRLAETMGETKTKIADKFKEMREDPAHVERARNYSPTDEIPRTQLVMAELMRGMNLDPQTPFTANDAIDLMHAVIPVSYCDFVLLDGGWAERVRQLAERGADYSPPVVPARCYSERRGGLKHFIEDLESWSGL
jgi:hypothetical protein